MAEKNIQVFPERLWAGTDHALEIAIAAYQMVAGPFDSQPEEDDVPFNFKLHGDVGVIEIRGSLVNNDSWTNRYRNVTSYADIRKALVYAANLPEAKAVLLDISSGGGAVDGVADTGDLIKMIDQQYKPVYSITDGTMASAAYWLGSSARKVYASKTSLVGSIGVIMTHMEQSKALKEAGIGVTVIRAGQFKALLNSFEPASKAALEQAADQLATAYGIFLSHVADSRGVTEQYAEENMAQGREFMGQAAMDAGLVDGIASFDKVLTMIARSVLDNPLVTQPQYGQYTGTPMKQSLTVQQAAAITAGVDPALVGTIPPATGVLPGATKDAVVEPKDEPKDELKQEAQTEPKVEAQAETKPDAVLVYVQTQLATTQTSLMQAQLESNRLTARVAELEAAQAGLMSIAAGSLNSMRVALNMASMDSSKLTVATVLAEHAATSATFKDMFKVGGISASSASDDPSVKKITISSDQRKARLASTV